MNVAKIMVMRCDRDVTVRRINSVMHGQVLEEVEVFKYLGSLVTAEGGVETQV